MIPPWLVTPLLGRAIPWVLAGFLAISLVVALLAAYSARTDLAEARTEHEKALRIQAEGYAQQVELAKADYAARVADHLAAYDQLTQELHRAQENETRLAADLRAGRVRVRPAFCLPGKGTASAAGVDEREGRHPGEGPADLIGAVDRLHAKYEACRAIAKGDRRGR